MLTLTIYFWFNIFIVMINQLQILNVPTNNVLKVLMYISFPLLAIVKCAPTVWVKINNVKLGSLSDRLTIKLINLIDRAGGTYNNLSSAQADYIKNDSVKRYGKRYRR